MLDYGAFSLLDLSKKEKSLSSRLSNLCNYLLRRGFLICLKLSQPLLIFKDLLYSIARLLRQKFSLYYAKNILGQAFNHHFRRGVTDCLFFRNQQTVGFFKR